MFGPSRASPRSKKDKTMIGSRQTRCLINLMQEPPPVELFSSSMDETNRFARSLTFNLVAHGWHMRMILSWDGWDLITTCRRTLRHGCSMASFASGLHGVRHCPSQRIARYLTRKLSTLIQNYHELSFALSQVLHSKSFCRADSEKDMQRGWRSACSWYSRRLLVLTGPWPRLDQVLTESWPIDWANFSTQDKWSPRITCFGEAMLWWPWCVLARLQIAEMTSRYK